MPNIALRMKVTRCRSRRIFRRSRRPPSPKHFSRFGTMYSSAAGSLPGNPARSRRILRHRHDSHPTCQSIRRTPHTTARSPEKCAACIALGADVAINYKTEDFVAATKKATGDRGTDVILDMIGGEYIERNYDAAAVEGRIVQIALQASPRADVDFRRLMFKRLTHTGSTLRARSVTEKGAIASAV